MESKELRRWQEEDNEAYGSISVESSCQDTINSSSSTFSSFDMMEDASSSSVSSLNASLYDFSGLMAQLPIKRGLSKFYEGKSQSFTSLASVEGIEDLVKKGCVNINYIKGKKLCRSHGGGLDHTKNRAYGPKATIIKKGTRKSSTFSKR